MRSGRECVKSVLQVCGLGRELKRSVQNMSPEVGARVRGWFSKYWDGFKGMAT